jgi:exosortase A-associated hydrolase 2
VTGTKNDGGRPLISGHYIHGDVGPLFVLLREPPGARHGVLVVPPFAEEMNKCRHMVTELANRLVQRGLTVVVPDLFGTGDSGGDFSDGGWERWQRDLQTVVAWCEMRQIKMYGLLAIRLGAALAASTLSSGKLSAFNRTVLWQPVFNGSHHLAQFLRLRIAASIASDQGRETALDLRMRLASERILEVAGYRLSGRLADELDNVETPVSLPAEFGAVYWMEVRRDDAVPVPISTISLIESSRRNDKVLKLCLVRGEPFWASTEVILNVQLLDASVDAFSEIGVPVSVSVR